VSERKPNADPFAKLKPNQANHLLELHDPGSYTQAERAKLFGVGRSTVYRTIERMRPTQTGTTGVAICYLVHPQGSTTPASRQLAYPTSH
jgi:hypothetical protein